MARPQVPFQVGSPIMISGPTGAGKTYFTYRLLTEHMFTEIPASILYCYGVYQSFYDQMNVPNLIMHEGVPSESTLQSLNDGQFHIIVLDDLMEYITKSKEAQQLFTKYCHHFKLTAIFLTQNVFAQGSCARNISLNTHILVLFANKRDESQSMSLARQLYPGKTKSFLQVYEDATKKNYGYLVIDCTPSSPREIKLRTNIFPNEQTIIYDI